MKKEIEKILQEYVLGLKNILGNQLKQVILYGSYARGDYNQFSDIDIMLLVDMTDEEISSIRYEISGLAFDIGLDNNVMISTVIKNNGHFNQWISAVPFYQNVRDEGVVLNG